MSIVKSATGADEKAQLDCTRMQDWEIAIAADAIPAERYAAEEFQRFFNEATGLNLPLRPRETPAPHQVCTTKRRHSPFWTTWLCYTTTPNPEGCTRPASHRPKK